MAVPLKILKTSFSPSLVRNQSEIGNRPKKYWPSVLDSVLPMVMGTLDNFRHIRPMSTKDNIEIETVGEMGKNENIK